MFLKGEGAWPPDKSGGYRMTDVPNKKLLHEFSDPRFGKSRYVLFT